MAIRGIVKPRSFDPLARGISGLPLPPGSCIMTRQSVTRRLDKAERGR